MKLTCENNIFSIELSTGKKLKLTHAEWMEIRSIQNRLIYTEPE